jgi:predicted nucleotidyltransferase
MARAPKNPEQIFAAFSDDLKKAFGEDLVSVILYGSGATGEYVLGRSDLNFLVILTDTSASSLRRGLKLLPRWRRRRVATPLFMTEAYIRSSLDSYPIEFLDMKANYRLVHGQDILQRLKFRPSDVRLQCEREIKGKALRLRQVYLEAGERPGAMRAVISGSITAFTSIFEGLLYLKGIAIPKTKEQVIRATSREYGLDDQVFNKLLAIRRGQLKLGGTEVVALFHQYIAEIDALVGVVDKLTLHTEESCR